MIFPYLSSVVLLTISLPSGLGVDTISDLLTSLAYFSIPITILIFVKKRKDFEYRSMLVCFILFIMLCGMTHLMHIIMDLFPFNGIYVLDNVIRVANAAISIITAILLWRMIPTMLRVPSPALLEKANQEIRQLAHYDHLTGLVNRYFFNTLMEETIAQAKEDNQELAVAFMDLDRFKMVNDTYGHEIGDLLLRQVSERVLECVGENDIVCRQGGDEFILLLKDVSNPETEEMMNRLIHKLSTTMFINGNEIHCTPSIGVSLFPADGLDAKTLIKYADLAMYRAKDLGRNNFQFFTNQLNENIKLKSELEHELRKAMELGQFEVYYQPQLDLQSNRIVSNEALLRWIHPEKGFIPPNDFIPLAEETGLIIPLGEWILNEACRQTKEWRNQGHDISVSVNLSNRQLATDNIVSRVREILASHDLQPEYLILEITESMAISNLADTEKKLGELKEYGVKIALDDFGTGYSSLSYLSTLPIHIVKIDKSFIDDIHNKMKSEIVKSIGDIARSIGLKVVAEGVEQEQQFHTIRSLGLELIQGFYLSKPIPRDEMEIRLGKQTI